MRILYGYKVEAGVMVPDEETAPVVRRLFELYLSGKGIEPAAREAGLTTRGHKRAGMILSDPRYAGEGGLYPPLIPRDTFDAAQRERARRAQYLGRDNLPGKGKWLEPIRPAVSFRWKVPGATRKNAVPSVKPCSTLAEAAAQAQSLYHMIKRK